MQGTQRYLWSYSYAQDTEKYLVEVNSFAPLNYEGLGMIELQLWFQTVVTLLILVRYKMEVWMLAFDLSNQNYQTQES